jgi:hypothetical protein
MVWHSFMLNPRSYLQYSRVAQKDGLLGVAWRELVSNSAWERLQRNSPLTPSRRHVLPKMKAPSV